MINKSRNEFMSTESKIHCPIKKSGKSQDFKISLARFLFSDLSLYHALEEKLI